MRQPSCCTPNVRYKHFLIQGLKSSASSRHCNCTIVPSPVVAQLATRIKVADFHAIAIRIVHEELRNRLSRYRRFRKFQAMRLQNASRHFNVRHSEGDVVTPPDVPD